jgi:DNA-binding XRE family transcriptional regulator
MSEAHVTKEELVEKIRNVEVRNGRAEYGKQLREEVLEYSMPRVESGESQTDIASELGIKKWTLNRWHQDARRCSDEQPKKVKPKKEPPAFVRLEPAREFGVPLEVMSGGRLVRVPVGFDEGTLARVLTLLEGLAR